MAADFTIRFLETACSSLCPISKVQMHEKGEKEISVLKTVHSKPISDLPNEFGGRMHSKWKSFMNDDEQVETIQIRWQRPPPSCSNELMVCGSWSRRFIINHDSCYYVSFCSWLSVVWSMFPHSMIFIHWLSFCIGSKLIRLRIPSSRRVFDHGLTFNGPAFSCSSGGQQCSQEKPLSATVLNHSWPNQIILWFFDLVKGGARKPLRTESKWSLAHVPNRTERSGWQTCS